MQSATLTQLSAQPNGFNTIRLLAALAVILSHSFSITGVAEPLESATGQTTLGFLAVGVFFVISGLLISESAERGPLTAFVDRRARRLLPCLVVAVVLCAAVLGPAVTTLPLIGYAVHPDSWAFLGNAVFLPVGLGLPGVFDAHPKFGVNGSLWTLKFEVACYAVAAACSRLRPYRRAAVLLLWLASFAVSRAVPQEPSGALFYLAGWADLFRFFGAGMVIHLWRDRLVLRAGWAWGALALVVLASATSIFVEMCATAGSYALLVFAYHCPAWFRRATRSGDVSYGVYVYAFPVQQLIYAASPRSAHEWVWNTAAAMPIALGIGAVSWAWVERPWLRRRSVGPQLVAAAN